MKEGNFTVPINVVCLSSELPVKLFPSPPLGARLSQPTNKARLSNPINKNKTIFFIKPPKKTHFNVQVYTQKCVLISKKINKLYCQNMLKDLEVEKVHFVLNILSISYQTY